MKYDKSGLLDYIVQFAKEYDWDEENMPKRLRALFTTWAILFYIDADTYECDTALQTIYEDAGLMQLKQKLDYDEFENYMVGLIV